MSDSSDEEPSDKLIPSLLGAFGPKKASQKPDNTRLSQLFNDSQPDDEHQDLPPVSSGPDRSGPPMVGTPRTVKHLRYSRSGRKGVAAKKELAVEQARAKAEKEKEIARKQEAKRLARETRHSEERAGFFSKALSVFTTSQSPEHTLGEFLAYVFSKPSKSANPYPSHIAVPPVVSSQFRWDHFFHGGYMSRLLDFWSTKAPSTASEKLDAWAIKRVCEIVRTEAVAVTKSEVLWSRNREMNDAFVLGFDIPKLYQQFTDKLAPTSLEIIRHIATSARQEKRQKSLERKQPNERKVNVCTMAYMNLMGEYSQTNSWPRQVLGLYLYSAGAQRQTISVLSGIGMTCGYSTLTGVAAKAKPRAPRPGNKEGNAAVGGVSGTVKTPDTRQNRGPQGDDGSTTAGATTPPATPPRRVRAVRLQTEQEEEQEWAEHSSDEGTPSKSATTPDPPADPGAPPRAQDRTTKPNPQKEPSLASKVWGVIRNLSIWCRRKARVVAATGLYVAAYDNVNMVDKVAEQTVARKDAQVNGTCATIFELHNTTLDALDAATFTESFNNAGDLTLKDISYTPDERQQFNDLLHHTILRIAVTYGGRHMERFRKDVEECQPKTDLKIALHKTPIHPLPSMEIDESSITGNAEVIDKICKELDLPVRSPSFLERVRLFAGDQLSIARIRSIVKYRAGQEGGYDGYGWIIPIPGLFHLKMAATHGVLEVFWGKPNCGARNPGSLWYHNTLLDRKPITLSSLPPFRTTRDLIFHSLYARVLHCLALVRGGSTLEDLATISTFDDLKAAAHEVLSQFANGKTAADLRQQRNKESTNPKAGDMVFESAILFMRDALILRELTDAIKTGDSGRVILCLKTLALSFRGNGRTKYAHETLHLLHNFAHVWPEDLRHSILNNWLVNPTGKLNAWVELDLVQEHCNFWIKKIYAAHGSNSSWDWLALISPAIDILRQLATKTHRDLGSYQGIVHRAPNITKDLQVLMDSLKNEKVYILQPGRKLDKDDKPAVDAITTGTASLIHGGATSPLKAFNKAFNALRERMRTPVLTGTPATLNASTASPEGEASAPAIITAPSPPPATDPPSQEQANDDRGDESADEDEDAAGGMGALEGGDDAELSLDTADDVALEMDLEEHSDDEGTESDEDGDAE